MERWGGWPKVMRTGDSVVECQSSESLVEGRICPGAVNRWGCMGRTPLSLQSETLGLVLGHLASRDHQYTIGQVGLGITPWPSPQLMEGTTKRAVTLFKFMNLEFSARVVLYRVSHWLVPPFLQY